MTNMRGRGSEIKRRITQADNVRKKVGDEIDYENWKKRQGPKTRQLGIKATVLKVYAEKGKLAAWQALQEYNKKLSGQGFTLEMLEQWIGEYEERQPQRMGKDDGFDR